MNKIRSHLSSSDVGPTAIARVYLAVTKTMLKPHGRVPIGGKPSAPISTAAHGPFYR